MYNLLRRVDLNNFELFLSRIFDIPLWARQVLYLKLAENMRENLCENYLRKNPQNVFANYVPTLTYEGYAELKDKKMGFDGNIYRFLQNCEKGISILEICVNSYFSMEETAKYFEFCTEQNLLNKPETKELRAMSEYIAGKCRAGEYLYYIGELTQEQFEKALELSKKDSSKKFGEILLSMNFVSEDKLKSLFVLKEEAQKRFILDYNSLPKTDIQFADNDKKYQNDIEKLNSENTKLKQKLQKLLELVKNEQNT